MILVLDYGMGNIRSVAKALEFVGGEVLVSDKGSDIAKADALVVPGVGSFDHAMMELRQRKLIQPLLQSIDAGKPYLGLCLGLQILFSRSAEGKEEGLGVLKGKVLKFPPFLKTPHMGWNDVSIADGRPKSFYFVHSYFVVPHDSGVVHGVTDYGFEFCSAVKAKNVLATQFHPEKSQDNGLAFLREFVEGLA